MKQVLKGIYYSFPVQLVAIHFRSNLLLVFLWLVLASIVGGGLFKRLGFNYFFLDPEYMGKVSFWSFFFIGLTFSGFLMAWNTAVYIINSYRFPFLATMGRPFAKFCLNNAIIPVAFIIYYLVSMVRFQWINEFAAEYSIIFYISGFISGLILGLGLASGYFFATNKDILFFKSKAKLLNTILSTKGEGEMKTKDVYTTATRVDYYLSEGMRPRIVRSVEHYDYEILEKVFRQNHVNALVIQMVSLMVLIALGIFMENEYFRIPAAASLLILFSVVITFLGALTYWLQEWRAVFLVAIILLLNLVTGRGFMKTENHAYGLSYNNRVSYGKAVLDSIASPKNFYEDKKNTLKILNNWKTKNIRKDGKKPKMAIICTTGGGLRAALWTMNVMQQADSLTKGKLMKKTSLMTGASGGMLGLGYFREMYLRKDDIDIHSRKYFDNMSKDLANAVAYTFVVNDFFVPWMKFEHAGNSYLKDRGYIFEQQLIDNTEGFLDKSINDYKEDELSAKIPMLFATPSIITDGRKMIISPHKVSYMMKPTGSHLTSLEIDPDAACFQRLFEKNNPQNLRFTSALRANATYPYILPNMYLPTQPTIQLMDAGFRDNFGNSIATRFCRVFADWIAENTSGVVFVQIRGSILDAEYRNEKVEGEETFLDKVFNPISSLGKVGDNQHHDHQELMDYLSLALGSGMLETVTFTYKPSKISERASMSFHLTQRERMDIYYAIFLKENQEALRKLKRLLK